MDPTRITTFATGGARHAGVAWNAARRQPSWLMTVTATVFMLVVALPIILLFVLALVAATIVFAALWGVNRIAAAMRSVLPRRDGRRNVRVLPPGERPGHLGP
jgi:hypothetical protein